MENSIVEFPDLYIESTIENFSMVKDWLRNILDTIKCDSRTAKQLFIAVDEIYTNISNYAYKTIGDVDLSAFYDSLSNKLKIMFKDSGIEYNPLLKPDPDISKRIAEHTVGGLGIFMAKKMVDSIEYLRQDGKNILILYKNIKSN